MRFEFATAQRVLFGPGTLKEVGPIAKTLGTHALVVTGRTPARAAPLLELLATHGLIKTAFGGRGRTDHRRRARRSRSGAGVRV